MSKRAKREKSGLVRTYYSCYWRRSGKKEREVHGHHKCEMPSIDSNATDNVVLKQLAWILSNPVKYHKEWISNLDSIKLKQREDEF